MALFQAPARNGRQEATPKNRGGGGVKGRIQSRWSNIPCRVLLYILGSFMLGDLYKGVLASPCWDGQSRYFMQEYSLTHKKSPERLSKKTILLSFLLFLNQIGHIYPQENRRWTQAKTSQKTTGTLTSTSRVPSFLCNSSAPSVAPHFQKKPPSCQLDP